MDKAFERRIERRGAQVEALANLLDAYSYKRILDRGFALVSSGKKLLRSSTLVTPGMPLRITFADGAVEAVAGNEAKPTRAKSQGGTSQGSLF